VDFTTPWKRASKASTCYTMLCFHVSGQLSL
jgi:hypothetical protein